MINLAPIPKKIQQRMFEKMNALGNYVYDDPFESNRTSSLTMSQMATRSTYIRMVSGQTNAVILMGGLLKPDLSMPTTYNDIYGRRTYKVGGVRDTPELDDLKEKMIESGTYTTEQITQATTPGGGTIETLPNESQRPMPGIKSIDATFKGGLKAVRAATINWTCWSFQELDYLMPHFLTHGKTVFLEWGWVYDKQPFGSDVFLETDTFGNRYIKADVFKSPVKKVVDKNGDLDMMTGIIKNFEFTTREDGAFDCQTIISSVGVSLIENTIPNYGSLDIDEVYNLDLNEDTEEVANKLRAATGEMTAIDRSWWQGTYHDAEKDKLLDLNTTVTLKAFLAQIDDYAANKMSEKGTSSGTKDLRLGLKKQYESTESTASGDGYLKGLSKNTYMNYIPNQFILHYNKRGITDFTDNKAIDKVLNNWVRWGWFEDNILSKFLSMTTPNGQNKVITEFRSIENKLDNQGNPTDTYESVRIRNHELLETVNINSYILPGQFKPMQQRQKDEVVPSDTKQIKTKSRGTRTVKVENVSKGVPISKSQPVKFESKPLRHWLKTAELLGLYERRRAFRDSVLNPSGVDILSSTVDVNVLKGIIEHDDLPDGDLELVKTRLEGVQRAQKIADETNRPLNMGVVNAEQEKARVERFKIDLPGDAEIFHKLSNITNQSNLFPPFATESDIIEKVESITHTVVSGDTVGAIASKYGVKSADIVSLNKLKNANSIRVGQKLLVSGQNTSTDKPIPGSYGYLRNMLINTRVIKEAFGVSTDGSYGVESINITEALQTMFDLINQEFPFWNFEVTVDSLQDSRVKIVDNNITEFDFNESTLKQATKFEGGQVVGDAGVFYFPTWQNNSIVKSQNITAKLPSSMAMATMYGSNMNQLKDFTNPGGQFSEPAGVIAGGLYNNSLDLNKNNIDIAFRNKQSRNIGNSNGDENEPLTINGGDDIFSNLKTKELEQKYETRLKDMNANIKVAADKKKELQARNMFDDSVPPPIITQLSDEQVSTILLGDQDNPELDDYFKKLYSSKYEEDGKMKKQFLQSISYLTTNHGEYANINIPIVIPLDLELDVDGIGGIYPGNSFHSNYLPSRYKHSTIFQAFDISHKVDNSGWTTSIGGKMRATKGGVFIGLKHIQKVFGEMYDNMVSRARINTKDALKFKKQQDKEFDKALAKK